MPTIIPLSEGAFTVDQTKKFIPFDLENDDLQKRNKGSLLVEIQPFAVITTKDIIVIDTGLGFADDNGHMLIHENLNKHGINASDVTKVLLSHLHKDHSGGIAQPNKKVLSFANAAYYVNEMEWKYAHQNNSSSYYLHDFSLLEKSSNLVFTNDVGSIDNYIHFEVTGAHCPYHQIFKIEDNNEVIFYGGDVAPQLQQMKNKFVAKYDFDGKKAMDLRQQWWIQGKQENWTFLFYHDIKFPTYKF